MSEKRSTTVVTCNCKLCNGITAEVSTTIAVVNGKKISAHKLVVLATMPYGSSAGCTVLSR